MAPPGLVDHYEVWRLGPTPVGTFVQIAPNVTTTSYTDSAVSLSTAYVYKVNAVGVTLLRSPDSLRDPAYTAPFADDPVVVNSTFIRAVHILELRQAVTAMCLTGNVTAPVWATSPPPPAAGALIFANHIAELRSNLDRALLALGLGTSPYTNPLDFMKAVHVQEIRNRIK